jgi:hypothetical protein
MLTNNIELQKSIKEEYLLNYNETMLTAIMEIKDNIIKQLKRQKIKAIKWINQHISKYNCRGITIIDWDELSNPNDLLEILGDKENE